MEEKLKPILDEYRSKYLEALKTKLETAPKQEEFAAAFETKVRDAIIPAMHYVGTIVKSGGHKTVVKEEKNELGGRGPRITLELTPSGLTADETLRPPFISYIANKQNNKVITYIYKINLINMSVKTAKNERELDRITVSEIQNDIYEFVRDVLSFT